MRPLHSAFPAAGLTKDRQSAYVLIGEATGVTMMFKSWFSGFLGHVFTNGVDRASRERAYLNAAVSRYDLESREREIDRGKFAGA
jgi:hypothetical protein